jgi:hypothetical protein
MERMSQLNAVESVSDSIASKWTLLKILFFAIPVGVYR